MCTSFAMWARSDAGGARTIDAPVSSATAAKRFASSQPFFPRISGYVLKFRMMAGILIDRRRVCPLKLPWMEHRKPAAPNRASRPEAPSLFARPAENEIGDDDRFDRN